MTTLDDDLDPVVIDNGTWMCKAGFAGDKTARVYERTVIGRTDSEQSTEFIGDEAAYKRELLHLTYPMSRGAVTDWEAMDRFWDFILRRQLRGGIEGRRVLITEVPGAPQDNRRRLTEILIEKFDVPALYISNPAYLALLSSGRTTGAVLDVGGGVANATAILRGAELKESIQRSEVGGDDVTRCLLKSLSASNVDLPTSQDKFMLGDMLKHHMTWLPDARDLNKQHDYSFPDGTKITVDGNLSSCFDVLFEPSVISSEAVGIDKLLYDVIKSCDADVQPTMCSNVIVTGGATMCADIAETMRSKIMARGITQDLKIVAPPERRKSSWLGGAILASLDEFPSLCKTRQVYYESGWREFLSFKESETVQRAEG